jgi:hypothetical protein
MTNMEVMAMAITSVVAIALESVGVSAGAMITTRGRTPVVNPIIHNAMKQQCAPGL